MLLEYLCKMSLCCEVISAFVTLLLWFCEFADVVLTRRFKLLNCLRLMFAVFRCDLVFVYQNWSEWDHHPAKLTMFTALHALHARGLDTSLSVSPPVKRVICDKTKERSVQIFIPHESESFSLVFREEEWLVFATPSTWNIGSGSPRWS